MTRFLSVTAAAMAVLAWSASAQATDLNQRSDAPSQVVKYDPSLLTTYSGAQQVYEKIQSAAWRVCLDMFDESGPDALSRQNCIDTLVNDTVQKVNSPNLTAVYDLEVKGQPIKPAERRFASLG